MTTTTRALLCLLGGSLLASCSSGSPSGVGATGGTGQTAGTTGSGGSAAGAGGATAGVAGSSGGAGGPSTGTGGATAGAGGATAGTGDSATGTGGSAAGTGGSAAGTGGATAGSGGFGTGGATAGAGGATAGTSGATAGTSGGGKGGATGGAAGGAGRGQGGSSGRGGASGTGGATGAGGAGGGGYVCNQVLGFTITSEWYNAGFENGVANARWQIKFREHGYITEWANPASAFWGDDAANGAPISSPCAQASTSPDHVVLNVLSWTITAQQEWTTDITAAVNTLVAKYPNLRRIDLMTVIRGPGNMLCPTPPAAGETIVMAPELDAAMQAVAAQFPGFVYVAPKFEATSCAQFSGGGPHLTTAGNTAMATTLAAYFATTQ